MGTLASYRSLEVLLTYSRPTTVASEPHSPNTDGLAGNCSGNLSVIAKGLKELEEGDAGARDERLCDLEESGNRPVQCQDPWKYIDVSSPHRKLEQVLRPESQLGVFLVPNLAEPGGAVGGRELEGLQVVEVEAAALDSKGEVAGGRGGPE
jgi:hypothetical protein